MCVLFKLFILKERFSRGGELNGIDTTKWWIPLTYTTECEFDFNRTLAKKWLSPNNNSISMEGPMSPGDWVIFNIVASGLYMVNYDEENWNLIINFLDTPFYQHIPQLNRVLLIDNAANLAWVGRLDYKIFFDLLKHLGSKREKNIDVPFLEIDIDPEYAALRALYDLSALLKRMPVHGRFMNYVREIFREMSDRAKSLNLDMYARKEYLQAKRHHQRSGILVIVSE